MGRHFEITVPEGLTSGSELEVDMPLAPAEEEPPYNIPVPPPPNASQGGVGEVLGKPLIQGGSLNSCGQTP